METDSKKEDEVVDNKNIEDEKAKQYLLDGEGCHRFNDISYNNFAVQNEGVNEWNNHEDGTPWVKTREEVEDGERKWENKDGGGERQWINEDSGDRKWENNEVGNRKWTNIKRERVWKNQSYWYENNEYGTEKTFGNEKVSNNKNYSAPRLMVTYRGEDCLDENDHRYVGLVNQASTCYLNSLIQTLYMTPEFRNAIYKWQFNGSNSQEHKSIQFQLQKLFLGLQTNQKSSLETKELTTSFGWDSNEAYDQHDVQELCRVMFDALEQLWRKSSNSKTIQDLYEGTVEDYVKCLNCGTESMRKDIFLDLPLSVKEFGATSPYKSVEEALDAFIKPEILNENNQYDCSKCCSKQDAEKGLRITEFPYLLTIQLKRFDFDYENLHRIKLNDPITFPDFLDINGHLYRPEVPSPPSPPKISYAAAAAKPKLEPISTSEEITPDDPFSHSTEDKTPVVSDVASTSKYDFSNEEECWLNVTANSEQVLQLLENRGKYIYELFSIMVHQGSASAGHYFAYIKNMDQNKWFCFNDSYVQVASKADIFRTFGGWSYGYMNNTNAYMLMYRRVDPERNEHFVRSIDLPLHLQELQKKILNDEQERVRYLDEYARVIFRCNEERCRNYSPLNIPLNKDTTLDIVFDEILKVLNEYCEQHNIKGGEDCPELEHKIPGCARLVLCARDWTMQDVLVQSDIDTSPQKNNDDGQIDGGYCVGSAEDFKRSLYSLIVPYDKGINLPEVYMMVDTRQPDEPFYEFGSKSSLPSTPMISPVVSDASGDDNNSSTTNMNLKNNNIDSIINSNTTTSTTTKEKNLRVNLFLNQEESP